MMNPGQMLHERYEIIRVIGKGGMSTVYQARDMVEGRLLAIKDIVRNGKEEHAAIEATLVAEGRLLKSLSNRHLPIIYDIIEQEDRFQLIMDYIEGESLDKLIARQGAQPMDTVLSWGMQICEVLDYLHNQPTPIIYRDMKPANLILQPDGQLMMIDFGTARTQKLNVMMAADTTCLGTAGFAAPEQFGGIGQSTPRTDIFCLGATLYNMITGHSPCDKPKGILPLEKWDAALKDTPISGIICKCTRNDPAARYQSARELYEDLKKARLGSFGHSSIRGNTGKLTGNLSRVWQKQKLTGSLGSDAASGVLAGLITHGKEQEREIDRTETVRWRCGKPTPVENQPPAAVQYTAVSGNRNTDAAQIGIWMKVMRAGLIVAVAGLLLGMVLLLFSALTVGLISVIVALGGAALAVIGLVFSRKEEMQNLPGLEV